MSVCVAFLQGGFLLHPLVLLDKDGGRNGEAVDILFGWCVRVGGVMRSVVLVGGGGEGEAGEVLPDSTKHTLTFSSLSIKRSQFSFMRISPTELLVVDIFLWANTL